MNPTVILKDDGLTVTPVTAVPVTFTVAVRFTVMGIYVFRRSEYFA